MAARWHGVKTLLVETAAKYRPSSQMCKHICASEEVFAALKVDSVIAWCDPESPGKAASEPFGKLQEICVVQRILRNGKAVAALKANGFVLTWGSQTYGADCSKDQAQLAADVQHIYSTKMVSSAVKADGSVVSWGFASEEAEALERRQ